MARSWWSLYSTTHAHVVPVPVSFSTGHAHWTSCTRIPAQEGRARHTPVNPCRAEPPSSARTLLQAPHHLSECPSGSPMPCSSSWAKSQAKPSPGAPDQPTPASSSVAPPLGASLATHAASAPHTPLLNRRIGILRPRSGRPEVKQIREGSAPATLLKRPWFSLNSTRSPCSSKVFLVWSCF
jgi:hypothetical protein